MKPSDVQRIRRQMKLSQAGFAKALGLSVRAVQDWEQGRHEPNASAVALLKLAESRPGMFSRKR